MNQKSFRLWIFAAILLFGCYQIAFAQSNEFKLPHSMKGYELYSWKNRGEWHFSLLIGTNRLKTFREVSSPKMRVRGVSALKRKLNQLVKGEEVSWSAGLVPRTVLPPEKIIDEVKSYCEDRGINLSVSQRGAGDASNAQHELLTRLRAVKLLMHSGGSRNL